MPLDKHTRAELVRDIETAFRGVSLGGGIGIREAWAIDINSNDEERNYERNNDFRDDWLSIPDSELEKHSSALCFMDGDGLRFALPAYMRFTIRHFDDSESLSVDAPIYALEHGLASAPDGTDLFTDQQRAVIAKFLRIIVTKVGENWIDVDVASKAYDLFWGQYDAEA